METLLACIGDMQRERGGAEGTGDPLQVARMALDSGLFADGVPSRDAMRIELLDAMDRFRAGLESSDGPAPRPHSVRWFHERAGDPVSSTGTMTVRQYCYSLLWLKMFSKGLNKGVDFLCSWLSWAGLLPPDNIAPRCVHGHWLRPWTSTRCTTQLPLQ